MLASFSTSHHWSVITVKGGLATDRVTIPKIQMRKPRPRAAGPAPRGDITRQTLTMILLTSAAASSVSALCMYFLFSEVLNHWVGHFPIPGGSATGCKQQLNSSAAHSDASLAQVGP